MRSFFEFILLIIMLLTGIACNEKVGDNYSQNKERGIPKVEVVQDSEKAPQNEKSARSESDKSEDEEDNMITVTITIGSSAFSAKLYGNDAAKVFQDMLPMTLNMSELNGNEKYVYLSESLPTDSQRVATINAGDLMLYGSDCVVLFYDSFSTSYSYSKLGYIENVSGLADALGRGSVEVSFAITNQ